MKIHEKKIRSHAEKAMLFELKYSNSAAGQVQVSHPPTPSISPKQPRLPPQRFPPSLGTLKGMRLRRRC